ncbi:hypothetical protein [Mariprofundus ferrooxydans]|uniref:Response regulatory domain-containing protein n=1 Tax=Mariprofundus ferrooxydans PV-1 TaxID=314345 RepID=Q0F0C2_9PROT|nr:hypothetical protein [Mariprofundus ferrooxydans]EAU55106.1 hypothetical protein SPV1_07174 [Mariprofundus ferrooxydans PV-1]KON46856.1 hypothetical protein AL013_10710 [Mariprofundus ferrooxydans]
MSTAIYRQKFATIIAEDTPAIEQLIAWLQCRDYYCRRIDASDIMSQPSLYHSSLILTDISPSNADNLNILQYISCFSPQAALVPLCMGGNTPAMRRAREIGVAGFLYINHANGMIDFHRGFAKSMDLQEQYRHQFSGGRLPQPSQTFSMSSC